MRERAVVAGVVIDARRVLVAQRRHGSMAGRWEFPGGKVEAGETLRQALMREMIEEFAAMVAVDAKILEVPFRVDGRPFRLIAFYVRPLAGTFLPLAHRAVRWIAPEALPDVDWTPPDVAVVREVLDHYRRGLGPWQRALPAGPGQEL